MGLTIFYKTFVLKWKIFLIIKVNTIMDLNNFMFASDNMIAFQ